MKYLILLLLGFNVILLNAQRTSTEIKNVKLEIRENKVIIGYDIVNYKAGQQFDIGIYFLDDESKSHFPKTVSGDVGNHVPGGSSRELVWDIAHDFDELNFRLRPLFIVNGMKQGANLGGPKWAYLSMAMPGMGDYFVSNHKEMIIKPYIRTAAFITLIGMGIKGKQTREKITYEEFSGFEPANPHTWWDGEYAVDEDGNFIPRYTEFTKTKTWLFNGDYEVFFAAAATVWFLDILYVAGKGAKNESARQYFYDRSTLQLGYVNQRPGFKFAYTF